MPFVFPVPPERLFDVGTAFLAIAFAGEGFLGALLLAGLQIEGMPFDLFDDIFLLDLPLEPAQRTFESFSLLNVDFSQLVTHPLAYRN